jgi:phage shock protein E
MSKLMAMNISLVFRCIALILTLIFSTHSLAETIWIDVRSELEHKVDSIEGDLRISHSDIVPEVQKLFPDTNIKIQLYCRSGGRAGEAVNALKNAGYTDVENIGSIEEARKYRGIAQ